MPQDTFTSTAEAAAPADRVWASLQRAETWSGLGLIDEVSDAVVEDGSLKSFRWATTVAGRRYPGTAAVIESTSNDTMAIELSTSEVAGLLEVFLKEVDGGTGITVTMTARSKGWLAGAFWGVIADALRSGLADSVSRFASGL